MSSVVAKISMSLAALTMLAGVANMATAAEAGSKKHNVVIQVSDDNEKTMNLALNNAVNLQKDMGVDNINIEVVAYGPGLKLMTKDSSTAERVKSLAVQNVTFSACGNTMKKVEKDTGKPVELTEGVRVVPAGVIRIMELQEQGYAYVRP